MCVIIDANVIGKVFNSRNSEHERFKPLSLWVTRGNGTVVYGGTKYIKELNKGQYLALFVELTKAGRAVNVDAQRVDDRARQIKAIVSNDDFDDEHIVALVGVSRCRLVCTDDVRSLPYLKQRRLYPTGVKVPNIYRSPSDKKHCSTKLLVGVCRDRSPAMANRAGKKPKARRKVEI